MIITLSPAKSLDFSKSELTDFTMPRQLDESERLIKTLRNKSAKKVKELMHISDDLAKLNLKRFQSFETPFDLENAKQSILAFDGDVYTGLEASTLKKNDLKYANKHLRILSGLYGLLRPFDLIQPYRLEMGTRLKTRRGTNLYHFWGDRITKLLNTDIQDQTNPFIFNLASKEYWKSVQLKKINVPVYDFEFLENRNGTYRFISFTGKKARGAMARFIIENRIENPTDVIAFDKEGYLFNTDLSTEHKFVFTIG